MKTIKINIPRSEVIDDAAGISVYAGVRRPGVVAQDMESEYRRVRTSPADRALLFRYLEEGIALALERFKDFVAASELSETGWNLQLNVSTAYDENLNDALRSSLRGFLISEILRRWFAITLPDRAAEYENDAARALRDCERKLCHRTAPKRKGR